MEVKGLPTAPRIPSCGAASSVNGKARLRFRADRSIGNYLDGMVEAIRGVDTAALGTCLDVLWSAWEQDRAVFIIGNGGSASTASHMANDLSKQAFIPG